MGGMTGIDDFDTIAQLDRLCDDIGVDTMDTGVAVAVAMDAGYKNFGDGQAAIEMVEEIAMGTPFGKILGNGAAAVGKHFNHKGQMEASRKSQIAMASVDCTGLCLLASFALPTPEGGGAFLKAMNAKLGLQMGPEDIPAMGIRVLKEELDFNRRAGFTSADDRLPRFFYEEVLPRFSGKRYGGAHPSGRSRGMTPVDS
jgi:aldehyde:ferredoxin oxidoreductase